MCCTKCGRSPSTSAFSQHTRIRRVPGVLFKSPEEHQTNYRLKRLLELMNRGTEPSSFLAKHPPGLQMGDGSLDSSPNPAEGSIELHLAVAEITSCTPLERNHVNTFDADIPQIACGVNIFEGRLQAGGFEGIRIMTCTVNSKGPHGGEPPVQRRSDLNIHSSHVLFLGEQIRDVPPVPGGCDRAVDQRCSGAEHRPWGRNEARHRSCDDRTESIPAPADR